MAECFLYFQLYNMFPLLGPLLTNWHKLVSKSKEHIAEMRKLIDELQETLNPDEQRGFVDCFLMRKKKVEVNAIHNTALWMPVHKSLTFV